MADSGALRLRPLDLLDILDETFRVYRGSFALFAAVSVILAIPSAILALGIGSYHVFSYFLNALQQAGPTRPPQADFGMNSSLSLLQYPLIVATMPFQIGLPVIAATELMLGGRPTVASVFRQTLRSYLPLLGLGLIILIGVFLPLSCVIGIPLAAWLGPRLSIAAPALFVERIGLGAALDRSWQLTRGAWTRTVAVIIVAYLGTVVVQFAIVPIPVGVVALIPALGNDLRAALFLTIGTVVSQLAQPLVGIGVSVLYFDLRVRREAFDLERMALTELAGAARPTAG